MEESIILSELIQPLGINTKEARIAFDNVQVLGLAVRDVIWATPENGSRKPEVTLCAMLSWKIYCYYW